MIGNYWNSAYRNLMKRKKFSFINVWTGDRHGIGVTDSDVCNF